MAEPAVEAVAETAADQDIVEGAVDDFEDGVIRVGDAALMYFEWCEERAAAQRKRDAKSGDSDSGDADSGDADSKARGLAKDARVAVTRFVSHCGPLTPISELTPHQMTAYQDVVGSNTTDVLARLQPVKDFLRFCWKPKQYTTTNLGNNIRIRRAQAPRAGAVEVHEEGVRFDVTEEGLAQMKANLAELQEEMPKAVQAVAQAREDKDIRENAPLEAARETQSRLQSRITELEYQIAHSVVTEGRATGRAHVGSTVRVALLDADPERVQEYTLVGPTEVDAASRRISIESPMGRGLLDQTAGSQVEIEAPRGTMRFRVVAVEG